MSCCLSSVQLLSRVRLFTTPWTAAHQASLYITNSPSLPKLVSIESVMPSNHLISVIPYTVFKSDSFVKEGSVLSNVSRSLPVINRSLPLLWATFLDSFWRPFVKVLTQLPLSTCSFARLWCYTQGLRQSSHGICINKQKISASTWGCTQTP